MANQTAIYQAIVVDDQDPEQRGRLLCKCRALLDEDTALPDWLEPCFPFAGTNYGWFFVPAPTDAVEIEVVVGDDYEDTGGEAAAHNPEMRWRAALYASTDEVPQEFRGDNYGKRMGLKSRAGMTVLFNDAQKKLVLITGDLRLGSEAANEPLVLGNVFKDFVSEFLGQYIAHVHPTGVGPSGPPATAAETATTQTDYIDSRKILSDLAFTQKK